MSGQLAKIKQQIAALEKQAQELLREENKKVIDRVKGLIAKHGLSAADLGFSDAGGPKSVSVSPVKGMERRSAGRKSGGVPMYRDPASGKTWTGRGKPPAWIAGAKDRGLFLIDRAAGEVPSSKAAVPLQSPKRSNRSSASRSRKAAEEQEPTVRAKRESKVVGKSAATKADKAAKGRAPAKQRPASAAVPAASKKRNGPAVKRSRSVNGSASSPDSVAPAPGNDSGPAV
jgi:DNA-binding protein H-NS